MITHGHPLQVNADGLVGALPARAGRIGEPHQGPASPGCRRHARRAPWSSPTSAGTRGGLAAARPGHARRLLCVPAQRGRGDAIHPQREPRGGARRLAGLVPLVVVTCGGDGAIAMDSTTGEMAACPRCRSTPSTRPGPATSSPPASSWEPARLAARPAARLRQPVGALSVQHFGGSLSAPGWGDVADWWRHRRRGRSRASEDRSLPRRYGFLADLLRRARRPGPPRRPHHRPPRRRKRHRPLRPPPRDRGCPRSGRRPPRPCRPPAPRGPRSPSRPAPPARATAPPRRTGGAPTGARETDPARWATSR